MDSSSRLSSSGISGESTRKFLSSSSLLRLGLSILVKDLAGGLLPLNGYGVETDACGA